MCVLGLKLFHWAFLVHCYDSCPFWLLSIDYIFGIFKQWLQNLSAISVNGIDITKNEYKIVRSYKSMKSPASSGIQTISIFKILFARCILLLLLALLFRRLWKMFEIIKSCFISIGLWNLYPTPSQRFVIFVFAFMTKISQVIKMKKNVRTETFWLK